MITVIQSFYKHRWRLLVSFLILLSLLSAGAVNGRIRVTGESLWYQYRSGQLTVKPIKTSKYGRSATQSLQLQLTAEKRKQNVLKAYKLNPYAHLNGQKKTLRRRNQVLLRVNEQKYRIQQQQEAQQEHVLQLEKQLDQVSEAYRFLGNLMLPATVITDTEKLQTIVQLYQQLPENAPQYAYYEALAEIATKDLGQQ